MTPTLQNSLCQSKIEAAEALRRETMSIGLTRVTRGPYDLDESESAAAIQEAADFVTTVRLGRIPTGHGAYREKRPGLGVEIYRYNVDCSVVPHVMSVEYSIHAWRTIGETRFGDSLFLNTEASRAPINPTENHDKSNEN